MKVLRIVCAIGLAAMIGCGDDDGGTTYDAPPSGFQQPAGTVAVNFSVDDTANKVYAAGDLEWKGSMIYDSTTRKVTKDSNWGGPWAPLFDDGPWNTGGHEPMGATAGDNKWGVTVFVTPPATGMDTYEYGLNDADYQALPKGDGWSWAGTNGTFTINAGATAAVTAQGRSFSKFGTTDLRIELDTAAVAGAPGAPWDTSAVGIKSSAWGWGVHPLTVTGGKATLVLSDIVGTGKKYNHSGLLSAGDKPEFMFVLGSGDGKEYRAAAEPKDAIIVGVTAGAKKTTDTAFGTITVSVNATSHNTTVTIP